jgi:hypothetical protein
MKPHIHAESSVKQFGGKPEDYLEIHQFMDCSKGIVADHRHRAFTHNTWFIMFVLPRVFGDTIKNSDGKAVSVRDIGEQHVLEDFRGKFIPSGQDWIAKLPYEEWMNNGAEIPASVAQPAKKDSPYQLADLIVDGLKNKPIGIPAPEAVPWKNPWPYDNPHGPKIYD